MDAALRGGLMGAEEGTDPRSHGTSVSAGQQPLGPWLRARRRSRRLTIRAAAGLAGVSPGFLSMIEKGQRRLNRNRDIVRLAVVLGLAPSELFVRCSADESFDVTGAPGA
jgi:hypothetical protein